MEERAIHERGHLEREDLVLYLKLTAAILAWWSPIR